MALEPPRYFTFRLVPVTSSEVRYDINQTLTEEQKLRARNNIGVGESDPNIYADLVATDDNLDQDQIAVLLKAIIARGGGTTT